MKAVDKLEDTGHQIVLAVGMHRDTGHFKMALSSGFRHVDHESLSEFIISVTEAIVRMREMPMDDLGLDYE